MTANLNTRATAFAQDFDREITRAYLLFQIDPMQQDTSAGGRARHALRPLAGDGAVPEMIKDVYVVASPDARQRAGPPQRFNPATPVSRAGGVAGSRWPRSASSSSSAAPGHGPGSDRRRRIVMRTMVPTVWPSVPALVIPRADADAQSRRRETGGRCRRCRWRPTVRYTVLLLDADYIKAEMLPAWRGSTSRAPATASTTSSRSCPRRRVQGSDLPLGSRVRARRRVRRPTRRSSCSRCGRRTSSRWSTKSAASRRSRR